MEEKHYYYKDGNTLLDSKHKLDETEIGNYVEITEEEYNAFRSQQNSRGNHNQTEIDVIRNRIAELKDLLASSDYKLFKYQDGDMTEEEYAPIRQQRHAWRVEINQLEAEIENAQ